MRTIFSIALATVFYSASIQAHAQTIYVTYTGKAEVNDGFGVFGDHGTLHNADVTVVYALQSDSILSQSSTSTLLESEYAEFGIGGKVFLVDNNDFPSRPYGVTNTNDGVSSSSKGDAGSDGGFEATNVQGANGRSDANLFANVILESAVIPSDFSSPFSYSLKQGDVGYGSFDTGLGLSDANCGFGNPQLTCSGTFDFTYTIARMTIGTTMPSFVPLPASAPLFGSALVTLGVAGYGLRRRKGNKAAAA